VADTRALLATRLALAVSALAVSACGNEQPRGPGPLAIAPLDAGTDAADAALDAAKKPVGDTCTQDDECETGACFKGGTRAYCTKHCAPATATEDCPVPPYTAVCNMQGFCKL
jgi:hypothetical protein